MAQNMVNLYFINVLEDEDDDYEELVAEYMQRFPPRVPRQFRDRINPMEDYNDEEFRVRFRVTKPVAIELLGEIRPGLEQAHRKGVLSPLLQLLIALRFYASASFQISVGDMSGVSKATVCRVIQRVSHCIALMYNERIALPADQESLANIQRQFYQIAEFPGVIGAIDCTHVAIQSLGGENGELYRNRKGYFSMNVQAVCGPDLRFHNVVARWYGSAHDATIFTQSRLHGRLVNGHFPNAHLLGDAGYPCKSFILTPLANPNTQAEQRYNAAHIQTRNTVERAFGVLKRRFPCLKYGLRIKNVTPVIVSCCILHNICLEMGDVDPPEEMNEHQQAAIDVPVPAYNQGGNAHNAKRTTLIMNHFS